MKTLIFALLFIFFICCKQDKNDYVNVKNIKIDTTLTVDKNEFFRLRYYFPNTIDTTYSNYFVSIRSSFAKKTNDSVILIIYLEKEVYYNDTTRPPSEYADYIMTIILTPKDVTVKTFKSNRHSTDEYKSLRSKITLNKPCFHLGDSIILNIDYFGRPNNYSKNDDSLHIFGKVKLQIKDAQYSYERLQQDNKLNQFLSEAKSLPDTIKYVYLFNSGINKLPNELALFKNCTDLNLGFNNLGEADLSILETLQNLKTIDLSQCHLSKLPSAILKLPRLEVINISINQLSDLPEDFYKLSNIKELNISDNKIKFFIN